VLAGLSLSASGTRAALVGHAPSHPREAFALGHGEAAPRRLTDSNPWLAGVALGRQEVVEWRARDGLALQGILVRPLDARAGTPPPLLLFVHGGPESHDSHGWVTASSRPGQLAAAHGYAVLYPNYRGSTGRGVEFSKLGQGDAAGPEFDDLVDAVEHLADAGLADRERVGIAGGSYGGYATAWCATRHTEHFRAGVMFVGVSDVMTKPLTTEIPIEDMQVHTRAEPWTDWQRNLERSPLYWAEQSRTALLIAGGADDARVNPAQSLQLYRALRMIGKTPVRYVRYPGEGHGNRSAAARDD
jgi:dipeptidyl aminopeptidase/acylaminoacyl peptidase